MLLTIMTPTYNREHTLYNLYLSLEKQKSKNFHWLIVDDGSTDNTQDIVKKIKEDASFRVDYFYKSNGGKHTAVNFALTKDINELFFIVDSDDTLKTNATRIIEKKWSKYREDTSISSLWFLQVDSKNNLIGQKFKEDEAKSNYVDVLINSQIVGDKKAVYRSSVRKKYLFPEFKNEKFMGEGIIHKQIANNFDSVFINSEIYQSEYLTDGLTNAGLKMRLRNPKGGAMLSKEFTGKEVTFKIRIKKTILFQVYSLLDKKKLKYIIKDTRNPVTGVLIFPISFIIKQLWNNKYL